MTIMFESSSFNEYLLNYYYSTLTMIGTDLLPTSHSELLSAVVCTMIGPVLVGIIIAQFSTVVEELTKDQKQKNDELDTLNGVMYSLRLPESIQSKILEYYYLTYESIFSYNPKSFSICNGSHCEKIASFVAKYAIDNLTLDSETDQYFDKYRFYQTISTKIQIAIFQADDMILKQEVENLDIYFIVDGMVEVIHEYKDYHFYNQEDLDKFYSDKLKKRSDKATKFGFRHDMYMRNLVSKYFSVF